MTISFQLRLVDLAAAGRYIATHNPSIKAQFMRAQIVYALITSGASLVVGWLIKHGRLNTFDILIALIAGLFIYFFSMYSIQKSYIKRLVALVSDKNPNFQRTIHYTIQAEGLITVSDLGTSTLNWSAIQHMDEDASYIYLLLPGTSTILIPKQAFANSTQQHLFATTLRSYVTQFQVQ